MSTTGVKSSPSQKTSQPCLWLGSLLQWFFYLPGLLTDIQSHRKSTSSLLATNHMNWALIHVCSTVWYELQTKVLYLELGIWINPYHWVLVILILALANTSNKSIKNYSNLKCALREQSLEMQGRPEWHCVRQDFPSGCFSHYQSLHVPGALRLQTVLIRGEEKANRARCVCPKSL